MSGIRALVTGASGGIGTAIARRLAQDGHHLVLHANAGPERAEALAAEIGELGGSAEAVTFDLRDAADTAGAMKGILQAGAIQILVHNAGIHDDAPLAGMSAEQWDRVVDVSLNGFFRVAQPAILPMIRSRWGRVICVSSISALLGNRGQVNYAAAKAGLHGAVKALALECASRGVTVNAVAPGIIAGKDGTIPIAEDRLKALIPMGRAGEAREVADLIAFLASDDAAYITGQVVSISGGVT